MVPEIAAPAGFTFNQYLIAAQEPLLFHTGPRHMFDAIYRAVERITPVAGLRRLAQLQPRTIAVMHGSCFSGDGAKELPTPAAPIRRDRPGDLLRRSGACFERELIGSVGHVATALAAPIATAAPTAPLDIRKEGGE